MLRVLVAVAALSQVVSQIDAQDLDLHVRTVDLKGDPVAGIQVKIGDIESQSDSNGLATFENDEPLASGRLRIQVNLKADFPRDRINSNYIGRVKTIRWETADQFASEFVIPLWEWGDVKSLGTAVVKNPDHYAVVLAGTRVVAKSEGDAGAWIEKWVPDLPAVTSPRLARSLYAAVEPGETVPQQFADEIAEVYREVERMNQAARICRRSPGPVEPIPVTPPPPSPPGNGGGGTPGPPSPPEPPAPPGKGPPGVNVDNVGEPPQVTTCKPVWVTETRTQQRVVRRPVTEQVMQTRSHVVYDPVTTIETRYVDQGSYVDNYVLTPGVSRNRLQWLPGGYIQDPAAGTMVYQPGGMHWVPTAPPATYQVQRQYVPNIVAQEVPITTYVQRVINRQEPVQVTRYVDEVVTEKVPVQVRKEVCETKTIRGPRTPTETSYRPLSSGAVVYDDTGWVGASGPR